MKIIVAIWTVFLTVYSVNGQSKSEVGIMGGVSYYLGDLNINKHF